MDAVQTDRGLGVLMVCMGNICRSPTAAAMLRHLQQQIAPGLELRVDSAGTHAYHVGEPADERAQAAARRWGLDLSAHRGRVITASDFDRFGYLLAMDRANLRRLENLRPPGNRAALGLLLDYAEDPPLREVPDPYYGGPQGFERVLELVAQGCRGLLRHLCAARGGSCG